MTRARDVSSRGGLTQVIPTSISVGSGSGSVGANGSMIFTGASSISINNCFTSTYTSYQIVLLITSGSATGHFYSRLRVSGSDNSTSVYNSTFVYSVNNSTTSVVENVLNQDKFQLGYNETSARNNFLNMHIINPQIVEHTGFVMQSNRNAATGSNILVSYNGGGQFANTTAFDGFTLFPASGTLTGTLKVYGYNNG
jgi:hypothetical protein